MATSTYNPGDVKVVWGVTPISGFAEGEMIRVTHQGDGVRSAVGAAGEVAFVESHNRSAEVVLRLMATSKFNTILTALWQAGNVALPLVVTDLSTNSTHIAGAAKLKRPPDSSYGTDVPIREWTFVIPKLEDVIGSPV